MNIYLPKKLKGGLKNNKMSKKAQSQIITTVLIILLVLAAIVIVWQVVSTTVRGGAEQVETQSACLGMNLVIVKASVADGVTVRREPGAGEQKNVSAILFVGGENKGDLGLKLNELDSRSNTTIAAGTFGAGNNIQVAAALSSGTLCPLGPGVPAVA